MKPRNLVLVTGASGFIGGRLVEKLMQEHDVRVRVLAPHFGRCARVARFPVELCRGDLADPLSLRRACDGVDTVFHLAYSGASPAANISGASHLGEAAVASGVRRFVHVSTISVYGETPPGPLAESDPRGRITDPYSATKAAVEKIFLELHLKKGLPLVVLQPTIVYGPFGGAWTVKPLSQVQAGRFVLPANGQGVCNAVYVDDVADACLLAAQREKAVGECFLISGAAPVTWERFYRAYERMASVESVTPMDTESVREEMRRATDEKTLLIAGLAAVWRRPQIKGRLLAFPPLAWGYKAARGVLPGRVRERLRRRLDGPWAGLAEESKAKSPLVLPDLFLWKLCSSASAVKIDKARRELGYEPRFDLSRGMALTEAWARWANLTGR